MNSPKHDPMRILVVTAMYPHAKNPASGVFVATQVEGLRQRGHHVDIVHIYGYRSKWNYVKGAIEVLQRTWRGRYDVVHAHYGLSAFFAIIRWRTPLVVTLHGSDALVGTVQPLLSRIACRFANGVIAVSSQIQRAFGGTIIPCGIDLRRFRAGSREESRRALGLRLEDCLVLFPFDPGRPVKRHPLAVRAVEIARRSIPGIRLWVVHGVPHERMPLYFRSANALILCSSSEGSPTVVKEALACGLPVVACDVGDVRDQLHGVRTSKIVDPTEVALANAICEVVADRPPMPDEMSRWAARFDEAALLDELVEVLAASARARPR